MSVGGKQSLLIIAYSGEETADQVYHTLRGLEKQDKIDIKTAATIYRREDGKLRLKHRQRLTLWRDEFGVEAIALMLAGTRAGKLAGAVVDALMGSHRLTHRREASALMEGKLGPDDSGLVVLATNADWEAVKSAVDHVDGEELAVELPSRAEKRLAEIASDEGVAAAVRQDGPAGVGRVHMRRRVVARLVDRDRDADPQRRDRPPGLGSGGRAQRCRGGAEPTRRRGCRRRASPPHGRAGQEPSVDNSVVAWQ